MFVSDIVQIVFLFLVVGFNALLALYVYKNNPRSATNIIYGLLGVIISLWLIVNYFSLSITFVQNSLFWIRFSIFFAAPMSLLFYFLSYVIPSDSFGMSKLQFTICMLFALLAMIVAISPYAFTSVNIINSTPQPIPGPGILVFFIITTGFSLLSIYSLVRKFRTRTGIQREQIRMFMYGIVLMLGLIILTTIVPVTLYNITFFIQFLPFYTAIFLSFTAYAIVKHRFLDIRAIVSRSVAFTLLIIALGLIYTSTMFLLGNLLFGIKMSVPNVLVSAVFALLAMLTFQPMIKKFESVTDAIFFKDKYDPQTLLAKLSRIMASTLELDEISKLILRAILNDMRISRGHVSLFKNKQIIYDEGFVYKGGANPKVEHDHIYTLVHSAIKKRGDNLLVYDEMDEGKLKDILRENNINVAIPLIVDSKPIGIIWFGEKLSGEIFSTQDLHLFTIIAPEVAVAVKNSLQYEEIRQFNTTLKREIDEATEKLREANKKLRELDKLKDDFVSVASHELRTPMTAIKSYLWMTLKGKGGKVSKKQQFYLNRAYHSTDRLIKLVNDMLNISRIESGRMDISVEKVNIRTLTEEIIGEVKPRADEIGVKIEIAGGTNFDVVADPDKIKEVLFNLLGNSLKFTPAKGTITVSFQRKEDMVITSVKDTGRGIDKNDLDTLFTKFGMIQGSYKTNKKASGTGLGLYISKSIIDIHQGKMDVFSEGLDQGSTFSFSLLKYSSENLKKLRATLKSKHSSIKEKIGIIHTAIQ